MKLTTAEYKAVAKDALKGNWKKAVLAMLLSACLGAFFTSVFFIGRFMAIMGISIHLFEGLPHFFTILLVTGSLLAVFFFFAGGPARFGYIDFNLALLDRREARPGMVVSRFSFWWKAVCMKIALFTYEFCLSLLLIVPGIIAMYSYAMVPYILEEKPKYTVGRAMRMSRKIMKGHKWQLFCLRFSFLGWYLVSILTAGFGLLYVLPYSSAAEAVFYNEISGRADVFYGRDPFEEEEED